MRLDHEICRCARARCLTQVSCGVRTGPCAPKTGPRGPGAGPRRPHLRNRSDSQGARGRRRGYAQNPATKSYLVRCAEGSEPWKNSSPNNKIYRAAFWHQGKQVDSYRDLEPVTKPRTDRVCRWALVSNINFIKSLRIVCYSALSSLRLSASLPIRSNISMAAGDTHDAGLSLRWTDVSDDIRGNGDWMTNSVPRSSRGIADFCSESSSFRRHSRPGRTSTDTPHHWHLKPKKVVAGGPYAELRRFFGLADPALVGADDER
jgi:hypothetical protein